jgi:hypothetical protein
LSSRVDPDGTVAHPGGFEVAGEAGIADISHTVSATPAEGVFSVAYTRFLAEAPYGTERVLLRHVSPK